MFLQKLSFVVLLAGALALWGCGSDEDGTGGSAGSGGGGGTGGTAGTGSSAGSGGTAGTGGSSGVAGLYSYLTPGTYVCLFVDEDRTKLVADPSCLGLAFRFLSNRAGSCTVDYPLDGDATPEIPIVNNRFEIETTRTDGLGEYTIRFSGEFNANGGVSGMATHTRDCPTDQAWSASPGCCSRCDWCQ